MTRKPTYCLLALVSLLTLLPAAPALAQSDDDLRAEIEALKRGQQEIRNDLQAIRKLLEARPAAAPRGAAAPAVEDKVFDLGSNPVKGDPQARLTLVEFTDFECGYCGRHHRQTFPRLVETFVDTGKMRYASLDLPLERIHKKAFAAARAAHCAGDQNQYWEMHKRLFENQSALEPWSGHAEALGLDAAAFNACMESGKYSDEVRKDMVEAGKAGATGTPSFVLGWTDPADPTKVTGLAAIRGAQAFEVFEAAIEQALDEEGGE